MRAQLALLNKKLQQESIVNERLMRRIMKDKASFIQRKIIIEGIVTAFMIPYLAWGLSQIANVSTAFTCFTCFFILLALACDVYIYRNFRPQEFMQGDLVKARKDTLRLKRIYANWIRYVSIPFIIVFFSWFIYELNRLYQGEDLFKMITSMAIGGIIGLCIGLRSYFKIQRNADDILAQIEEFSND